MIAAICFACASVQTCSRTSARGRACMRAIVPASERVSERVRARMCLRARAHVRICVCVDVHVRACRRERVRARAAAPFSTLAVALRLGTYADRHGLSHVYLHARRRQAAAASVEGRTFVHRTCAAHAAFTARTRPPALGVAYSLRTSGYIAIGIKAKRSWGAARPATASSS
jgi:hypothetical protein